MIESTVTTKKPQPARSLFPSLRVNSTGTVFLFTEHTNGNNSPVVHAPGRPEVVGRHFTSADLNDPDAQAEYLPFDGTVTIKNAE